MINLVRTWWSYSSFHIWAIVTHSKLWVAVRENSNNIMVYIQRKQSFNPSCFIKKTRILFSLHSPTTVRIDTYNPRTRMVSIYMSMPAEELEVKATEFLGNLSAYLSPWQPRIESITARGSGWVTANSYQDQIFSRLNFEVVHICKIDVHSGRYTYITLILHVIRVAHIDVNVVDIRMYL